MKNLLIISLALCAAVVYLPIAEAADTANLGLEVTFRINAPLELYTDPNGPFNIEEGKLLEFNVIANDRDAATVTLEALALPDGANFEGDNIEAMDNYKRGTFKWTPKTGQGRVEEYKAEFRARSTDTVAYGSYEEKRILVSITVRVAPVAPVIAIELNNDKWLIGKISLGSRVRNVVVYATHVYPPAPVGPLHLVKNTGNIAVGVDMSYAKYSGCKPDLKAGQDTFATILSKDGYVNGEPIPPEGKLILTAGLEPEKLKWIWLEYHAPTALSADIEGMSAVYGLRAFPAIKEE